MTVPHKMNAPALAISGVNTNTQTKKGKHNQAITALGYARNAKGKARGIAIQNQTAAV